MGEVYLADDPNLHRRVAIKVLRADLTTNKDRLQRFKREAQAASSLNHPNILTIHEIGSENEDHFIVTEFVDGESLRQHLVREPFELHQVLKIGIQLGAALGAAHAAGIVHRDIKPDNIMLRRDNLVKVLDFGLAKLNEPESAGETEQVTWALPLTTPGVVMGTAQYMSPEQARGLPMDARTDIWSLGVVLYEMVTAHLPFTGNTMSDIIVSVLTTHPPLLTTYRADVPAELERIITKALRKKEEERYQVVKDLELDLKSLKQRLEFEAELSRSGEGRRSGEHWVIASGEHSQTAETVVAERHAPEASSASRIETRLRPVRRGTDPRTVFTGSGDSETRTVLANIGRLTSFARQRWKALAAVAVFCVVALAAVGVYLRLHRSVKLTDKDTIVLADFINTTGDSVFDGTLRQGLASQLEQSPFLSLMPDERIGKTLALMERPKDARLTQQLARDICRRTGSKATIEGSISGVGGPYTLTLKAVDCQSGDVLMEVQERAARREQVLQAEGSAATKLRKVLGESLASIQKYDVAPENVTTGSLEALRAYSQGHRAATISADYKGAVLLFQEATRLDPNFAMAYARLAAASIWTGNGPSPENARKAYDLRERVSERERFYIESTYENFVTENLEASRKIYERWMQLYPRDDVPPYQLANIYGVFGEYDKVLHLKQESLKLEPHNPATYLGLIGAYMAMNRFDEARATIEEGRAQSKDYPGFHTSSYFLAFLQHDTAGMEREVAYLTSSPASSTWVLCYQSDTLAYGGQMSRARELAKRAVEEFKRAGQTGSAGEVQSRAALREALMGNLTLANHEAEEALNLTNRKDPQARYSQAVPATVFALAGDSAKATRLADDLERLSPENTKLNCHYLPMIRGATAMKSGNPAKAIEALSVGERCELGGGTDIRLYRVYLRGIAYLAMRQGTKAAAEFQKILDHPGVVANEPIGALAHLGLGRACAMAGDTTKARAAYQDFFALWKDADPDIPILKEAQAEYGKMK